jgi:hypothetical protein
VFKDVLGTPEVVYYEAEFPLGVVNVYPKGDSTYELHLSSWKQLPTYTNLSNTVSLPPGYERAIRYNLAVELAPEYAREPSGAIVDRAERAKANIKRTNTYPPALATDPGILRAGDYDYNIDGDTY